MPAALVTIPGVEIARTGSWNASTGKWLCTAEDIADAVRAQHDTSFRKGVIKLGHDDDRFGDGQPAIGRLENLRAAEDGQVLVADLVGVPAWLAEIIPTAYPSRSIEASIAVVTKDGAKYGMVVTGLALLGITAPAIANLADLADRYQQSTDLGDWVAAEAVAASFTAPGGHLMPDQNKIVITQNQLPGVRASASLDDIYDAFGTWAKENVPSLSDGAYLREIYTDYIIAEGWMGDLWRASWSESGGVFTFSDATRVKVVYEPVGDSVAAAAALAGARPLRSPRGRVAAASNETEHRMPDITGAELRKVLGLKEDATEDEVRTALTSRAQTPGTATDPVSTGTGEGAKPLAAPAATVPAQPKPADAVPAPVVSDPASVQDLVNAAVASAVASAVTPFKEQVTSLSTQLADRNKRDADVLKESVLASAVNDGKITPADREAWGKRYDKSPEVTAEILASLAAGTAFTVRAAGSSTAPEAQLLADDDEFKHYEAALGINRNHGQVTGGAS